MGANEAAARSKSLDNGSISDIGLLGNKSTSCCPDEDMTLRAIVRIASYVSVGD